MKFVNKAVRFQVDRQRAVIGENPDQSLAWQEPPIMAAFEDQSSGQGDMCMFRKTRPDNLLRVKKRTRFEGTHEVVEAVSILCDGSHEHSPIEGNMKIDGKTCRVSEWAGGYTKELARAMIKGAEKYLKKIYGSQDTYPVDSDSTRAGPPSEYREQEYTEEDMKWSGSERA